MHTKPLNAYKNHNFHVLWDGRVVAGVSKVGPLKRTTNVITHRSGGDPHPIKSPGTTDYTAILLERGITHDPEFEKWARSVFDYGALAGAVPGATPFVKDFRKDITIEVHDAGVLVLRYFIYRCWVSEYQATAELNADDKAEGVLIETIKLENEGWEPDRGVNFPDGTNS
jgi:phage tail-like protein